MSQHRKFLELINPSRARRLEHRDDSACGLWRDLSIAYVNPAWRHFAAQNGGHDVERWCEGASFVAAIDEPLREYYARHLRACLASPRPWVSQYECSSPRRFRLFRMTVRSLDGGRALLLLNTCLIEREHEPANGVRHTRHPERYLDEDGLIHQCIHCRRVRQAGSDERWDWVAAWVAHVPDNASGGLCPSCLVTRYPELARNTA